ncbi:lantibiotic dehydratase [Nonomuraea zeae]|uniref:Lantibiotic dehydratase n=1 Tax=Nonomuraea zeae TaxID=1642303 RepID=A0A5S4GVK1_9ACTN|nr:lantibiotic dehydratase [Nonomuraea zeae]TMR36976.1 hypothetical protein ETD85_09510 [Nonomuraea zeae]
MAEGPRFVAAGFSLLRMPAAPITRFPDILTGGEDEEFLAKVLRDPLLREALEVSSNSLAAVLDRIQAGQAVEASKRRRAIMATARYVLRMTGRPTPFGLLAGVAMASFGETTKVRLSGDSVKGVRPDAGWLAELLADWERRPHVRRHLRLVANDLCVVRGDRLVLPYVRHGPAGARHGRVVKELSVLYTEPVQLALEWAARPRPYTELLDRLAAAFPLVSREAIEAMMDLLMEYEVLLTDLHPPLNADPLAYVLNRLATGGDLTEAADLREIAATLEHYAQCPPGEGRSVWRTAVSAMRALQPTDHPPIHVDLRVGADVTLPQPVADEAAATVTALLRMSAAATAPKHVVQYHHEFLERYGIHQLIPLKELTDPERGLGVPDGYHGPETERGAGSAPQRRGPRDTLLLELAARALHSGLDEVILDDELVGRLAGDETLAPPPPESAELCVQVLAETAADLDAGDFRLVVSPATGSSMAGSVFGRFAYLFPESDYPMAPAEPAAAGPVRAQLLFQPGDARVANVARAPVVCDHTLTVGAFAERSDPRVLSAQDLLVGADERRLFLVSAPHGREIVAISPHVLMLAGQSPHVVRLISEITGSAQRQLHAWSWGAAELLPKLPRVRYRRTVLAPARWLPDPRLRDKRLDEHAWLAALEEWRSAWQVPDRVYVAIADNRVELDLAIPLHRRLLRHELTRTPDAFICELPGTAAEWGWLDGHANEIVIPLTMAGQAHRAVTVASRPEPAPGPRHLPGGEWLYAKLYSSADRHDEILGGHLTGLVSELPASVDRWFFLRYADPDPHLRLRFHGDPAHLHSRVLPALHDWAATLTGTGLAARLALDTYEPEVARYGGPEAIEAAERVFAADSLAVLAQFDVRNRGLSMDQELLAAANYVDLLRGLGDEDWQHWLLAQTSRGDQHAAFQATRRTAIRLIDTEGDWAALAVEEGGADVLQIWQARRAAVAAYGETVRRLLAGGRLSSTRFAVVTGLLHLHHNRSIGIRPVVETRTLAIMRGVVDAALSRKRFSL